jgi:hypothetical protein
MCLREASRPQGAAKIMQTAMPAHELPSLLETIRRISLIRLPGSARVSVRLTGHGSRNSVPEA